MSWYHEFGSRGREDALQLEKAIQRESYIRELIVYLDLIAKPQLEIVRAAHDRGYPLPEELLEEIKADKDGKWQKPYPFPQRTDTYNPASPFWLPEAVQFLAHLKWCQTLANNLKELHVPVKIEKMDSGDFNEVLAVWVAAGLKVDPRYDTKDSISEFLAHQWSGGFVAEKGGKAVGAVLVGYTGREAWMYHLAVIPRWQHNGIGSQLVAAAEELCLSWGAPKINLSVAEANGSVSAFYQTCGFSEETGHFWMGKALE